ncbi:MAG TPA: hypothetical protein VKY22_16850 [Bradyrhizobium sp.]|nr:hypothetical protein [Bradyrhizobium sp.]
MAEQARKEFGKRRRAPPGPPAEPPPKRSSHVALLLMGTFAVGGAAYALMPRQSCTPASPGMAAPASPGVAQPAVAQPNGVGCASRSSTGGSGGYHSSRYGFFGGGGESSGRSPSGASSSEAGEGSVSRGGFGSLARAFGFSGRG